MGTRINYYSTPGYWYPILLILNIWKNTGYNTIVYLAAITGIDEGLYEAAYIDGATRFKRIIYITIPLLAPTICIMTLMSVGRIFYGDFGMLYAIIRDNSSLMPIAEVIDTYVYRTFKNTGDPSLSMAIGLYQSIVGFILVFTANWIVRRSSRMAHCSDTGKGDKLMNSTVAAATKPSNTNNKIKHSTGENVGTFVIYLVVVSFALICVLPFVLVIIVSFSSEKSITINGYSFWPSEWSLQPIKCSSCRPHPFRSPTW